MAPAIYDIVDCGEERLMDNYTGDTGSIEEGEGSNQDPAKQYTNGFWYDDYDTEDDEY